MKPPKAKFRKGQVVQESRLGLDKIKSKRFGFCPDGDFPPDNFEKRDWWYFLDMYLEWVPEGDLRALTAREKGRP